MADLPTIPPSRSLFYPRQCNLSCYIRPRGRRSRSSATNRRTHPPGSPAHGPGARRRDVGPLPEVVPDRLGGVLCLGTVLGFGSGILPRPGAGAPCGADRRWHVGVDAEPAAVTGPQAGCPCPVRTTRSRPPPFSPPSGRAGNRARARSSSHAGDWSRSSQGTVRHQGAVYHQRRL